MKKLSIIEKWIADMLNYVGIDRVLHFMVAYAFYIPIDWFNLGRFLW